MKQVPVVYNQRETTLIYIKNYILIKYFVYRRDMENVFQKILEKLCVVI